MVKEGIPTLKMFHVFWHFYKHLDIRNGKIPEKYTLKNNSLIWFCFFLDKIKIAPDLVHNFSNFPNIITTTK